MKYLIHVRPSEEIFQRVVEFRNSLGLSATSHTPHSTLLIGTVDGSSEDALIVNLERICQAPFTVDLAGLDLFDKNSLVIRLEKTARLVGLHYAAIEAVNPVGFLAQNRYAFDNYSPHMTIGHHHEGFALPRTNPLSGLQLDIRGFHLSKTEENVPKDWKYVREFLLSKS